MPARRARHSAGTFHVQHLRLWGSRSPGPIALTAVLLVAGLLRTAGIGTVGLNSDEAVYAGQGASLSDNDLYTSLFPVVRAHPLLLQTMMSPLFAHGVHDVSGRLVVAAFGLGTVAVTAALGRVLYGAKVGVLAALLLAVMPYHVLVSRQILLDAPMTFFASASLLCVARYVDRRETHWILLAATCLGLATLTKETALVLGVALAGFFALNPSLTRPVRPLLAAGGILLGTVLIYPLGTALAGGSSTGRSYLLWQLTRRPNHGLDFYLTTTAPAIGVLVLVAALAGLTWTRRRGDWRRALLLSWIAVPVVFFVVWPVKGYQYLLPAAVPVAVLAARALATMPVPGLGSTPRRLVRLVAVGIVLTSLVVPTAQALNAANYSGLAGTGGMVGGRETGRWVQRNVPRGARLLTIGPSMANVLQYYSGHPADGLSVSPNPLHRNPAYSPVMNPDAALRGGEFQYVVWDRYSAQRSPYFAARATTLARRYGARVVHTQETAQRGGGRVPVVIVWEVHP